MKTITLTLAVALDSLADVVDALSALNGVQTITVGESSKSTSVAPIVQRMREALAEPQVKQQRRDAGKPRGARVVYDMGKRITADRIKSLASLTDTQRTVALYIAKHAGKVGMRDVQHAFNGKINSHTVDGTIYALRKHDPAIIVSRDVAE